MRVRILHVDLRGAATPGPRAGTGSRLSPQLLAGADEGRLGSGLLELVMLLVLHLVFAQHGDGVVVVLQRGQRLQAHGRRK